MPRTAPTIDGTTTVKDLVIKYIDYHGRRRSDRYPLLDTATPANIETLVSTLATNTNANIYDVQVVDVYAANPIASSALDDDFVSTADNIVWLLRGSSTGVATNGFLPAPVHAMLEDNSQQVNLDNTAVDAIAAAFATIIPDTPDAVSVRFTQRSDRNPRQYL